MLPCPRSGGAFAVDGTASTWRRHVARLEAAGHVPDAQARERRNRVPAANAKGGGHGIPPPPLSLQEDGRIRRIPEDVSEVGRSP